MSSLPAGDCVSERWLQRSQEVKNKRDEFNARYRAVWDGLKVFEAETPESFPSSRERAKAVRSLLALVKVFVDQGFASRLECPEFYPAKFGEAFELLRLARLGDEKVLSAAFRELGGKRDAANATWTQLREFRRNYFRYTEQEKRDLELDPPCMGWGDKPEDAPPFRIESLENFEDWVKKQLYSLRKTVPTAMEVYGKKDEMTWEKLVRQATMLCENFDVSFKPDKLELKTTEAEAYFSKLLDAIKEAKKAAELTALPQADSSSLGDYLKAIEWEKSILDKPLPATHEGLFSECQHFQREIRDSSASATLILSRAGRITARLWDAMRTLSTVGKAPPIPSEAQLSDSSESDAYADVLLDGERSRALKAALDTVMNWCQTLHAMAAAKTSDSRVGLETALAKCILTLRENGHDVLFNRDSNWEQGINALAINQMAQSAGLGSVFGFPEHANRRILLVYWPGYRIDSPYWKAEPVEWVLSSSSIPGKLLLSEREYEARLERTINALNEWLFLARIPCGRRIVRAEQIDNAGELLLFLRGDRFSIFAGIRGAHWKIANNGNFTSQWPSEPLASVYAAIRRLHLPIEIPSQLPPKVNLMEEEAEIERICGELKRETLAERNNRTNAKFGAAAVLAQSAVEEQSSGRSELEALQLEIQRSILRTAKIRESRERMASVAELHNPPSILSGEIAVESASLPSMNSVVEPVAHNGYSTIEDLARLTTIDKPRLDGRLRRLREKYPDCFIENESPRRNEAKYLYRTGEVLPLIRNEG